MKGRNEDGSAAVELVMMAPVLLVVISVIVAAGRVTSTKSAIEAVAREAARAASQSRTAQDAQAEGHSRGIEAAQNLGLDEARLELSIDTGSFARGAPLVVEATYEVSLSDVPGLGLLPGRFTVAARQVETVERFKSR